MGDYSGAGGLGAVTLTGTPAAGQVPTATSATAATWQTPATGLTAVPAVSAAGSKAGNYTTVSAVFADVDAVNLAPSIAAAAGDILLVTCQLTMFSSNAAADVIIRFICTTSGTVSPQLLGSASASGNALPATLAWSHTVAAGDIAAGVVAVKLQFSEDGGGLITGSIQNVATEYPVMTLANLKH